MGADPHARLMMPILLSMPIAHIPQFEMSPPRD